MRLWKQRLKQKFVFSLLSQTCPMCSWHIQLRGLKKLWGLKPVKARNQEDQKHQKVIDQKPARSRFPILSWQAFCFLSNKLEIVNSIYTKLNEFIGTQSPSLFNKWDICLQEAERTWDRHPIAMTETSQGAKVQIHPDSSPPWTSHHHHHHQWRRLPGRIQWYWLCQLELKW